MAKKVKDLGLGKNLTPKAKTPKAGAKKTAGYTSKLSKEDIKELGPIMSIRFFNKAKNPKRFDNKKRLK